MYLPESDMMRGFRLFLICVIGLGQLTACSSGGDESVSPPAATGGLTPAEITVDNATTVAGVVAEFALDGGLLDLLIFDELPIVSSNGAGLSAAGKLSASSPISAATSTVTECAVSGTVDVNVMVTDPTTPSEGDQYSFEFIECDDGTGSVLNGGMSMTITGLSGDLAGEPTFVEVAFEFSMFSVTSNGMTDTVHGTIRASVDQSPLSHVIIDIKSPLLTVIRNGVEETVANLSIRIVENPNTIPSVITAETSFNLASDRIGGEVTVTTSLALESSGDGLPYTGELRITGDGNTSIALIAIDANMVRLEIDTGDDGTVDHVIEISWEELLASAG